MTIDPRPASIPTHAAAPQRPPTLARRPLRDHMPLLQSQGAAGTFARYVAARAPEAPAPACLDDGVVVASAIAGRDHGMLEAYAHWIFADSAQDAAALAATIARADEVAIDYALEYAPVVDRVLDGCVRSIDRLYIADARIDEGDSDVVRLDTRLLAELTIDDELRPMIGSIDAWPDGSYLYGVVVDRTLVCIAESTVRDDRYAAIQQVYTLRAHRGRGHARRAVAHVANRIANEGLRPIYLVADANASSIAVVERLGFSLHARLGCAERV